MLRKNIQLLAVISLTLTLLTPWGCSKQEDTGGEDQPEQKKSTVEQITEDVTGITTIRKGEETKDRIRDINKKRERQLQDTLNNSE
ncbi:MAG: hypothetical protein R6V56_01920 [Lentisphaeria bacterium]